MQRPAEEKSQELYRGWLMRKLVVAGLTKDKLMAGHDGVDKTKLGAETTMHCPFFLLTRSMVYQEWRFDVNQRGWKTKDKTDETL